MATWKRDSSMDEGTIKWIKHFGKPLKVAMKNGYEARWSPKLKEWEHRHILSYKKKCGIKEIPKGFHVHHIDQDPENNNWDNLVLLHKSEHKRLHKMHKETGIEYPLIKKKKGK
jgi:hypothetical protein